MKRFIIPAAVLVALLAFTLLRVAAPNVSFALLALLDIPKVAQPFSDLAAVLRAVRCAGQGVDVYMPNACMGGGTYNYSPVLLHFTWLGGLSGHVVLSGFFVALLFIAALAALPPPQGRFELLLRLAASLSAAVIFVLERANLDALIFVVAVSGVLLWLRGSSGRLAGYALFCFCAALKFYPVALLTLLLRERPYRLLAMAALLLAGALGYFALFGAGTLAALAVVPHGPPFGNCFGAVDIPLGISLGLAALHGAKLDHLATFHMPPAMQLAYLAMIAMALWRGQANMALYRRPLATLEPARLVFLIAGAALACACFFLAQNILYRAAFLLLVLPAACSLATTLPRARALAIVIVLLMWESLFRIATLSLLLPITGPGLAYSVVIMVWLCRELLWWWMATQLLAVLLLQVEVALHHCQAVLRPLRHNHT